MLGRMTTPRPTARADAAQRAAAAWNARVLGASWEQAAEIAGFANAPNAHRAVTRAYGQVPEPERSELRRIWRERLEVLWRQSVRDVTDQRAGAVTAGVRVAGAAASLDGLDEPTRIDLSTPTTAEMAEWLSRALSSGLPVEYDIVAGEVESGSID